MTEIQKAKINNELVCEEEDDSSSEDEEPSFLKVMVEKQEDVEKTVSLIKKEIARQEPAKEPTRAIGERSSDPKADEFVGLNKFLTDDKVKAMIRNVGSDTSNVIEKALGEINSKDNLKDKRDALSIGIKQLQLNLRGKKDVGRDPNYNLAMSLIGLRRS